MSRFIKVSAPARIDFGGSTLDLSPITKFFPQNVVTNLAISLRTEVILSGRKTGVSIKNTKDSTEHIFDNTGMMKDDRTLRLFYEALKARGIENGVEIRVTTGSPYGAGLGGSSVLLTALLKALDIFMERDIDDVELIDGAAEIESRIIGGPTGKQDYIAAVHGGLNAVRFPEGASPKIERLETPPCKLSDILYVFFTGKAHFSGDNNFTIAERCLSGNKEYIDSLRRIEENSIKIYGALKDFYTDSLIAALRDEMRIRRDILPSFTNEKIDQIERKIIRMGGALKVCGAGGGGSVFAITPGILRDRMKQLADDMKIELLDCGPDPDGLIVEAKEN